MAWNFLGVVDGSGSSGAVHPVPDDNKIGIEVTADDGSVHTHVAQEIVILRHAPSGGGIAPLISVRGAATFVLTLSRVCVVVTGASAFGGPLATTSGRPASGDPRGGSTLLPITGQVRLDHISQIGAAVKDGVGRLLITVDESVSPDPADHGLVGIEVHFVDGVDVAAVANELIVRTISHRIIDPAFADMSDAIEEWLAIAATGLHPSEGAGYQTVALEPFRGVRPLVTPAPNADPGSPARAASAPPAPVRPSAASASAPPPPPPPQVPATWAADPTGRFQLRYWDGSRWTEHVSTSGTTSIDPMP